MKKSLSALIIEDSAGDAKLIVRELQRGDYEVTFEVVETAEAMRAAFARQNWDVILSDYSLPHFSGTAAMQMARELAGDAPFIYVSGAIGEDAAVQAMKAGAQDYVMKDRLARLVPAIERELREASIRREASRADVVMRESEHKYRHLFEALSDAAFLIVEETGVIIDTNAQGEVLLGRARSEIVGMRESQLYPPGAPPIFSRVLLDASRTGRDTQVLRRDGVTISVHVSASRVELHGRSLVLLLFRDITERERSERALNLFRSLIDRTNDTIEVVDPATGRFINVNETACRVHGYSREEYLQLHVSALEVGLDLKQEKLWHDHMAAVREKRSLIVHGQHRRKDGSVFPVEVSTSFIHLDRDYVVAVVRDVTERKRAEETMQADMARLQRQEETLTALTKSDMMSSEDYMASLRRLTEAAGKALDVARVSLWRYLPGNQAIRCADLYELADGRHSEGVELTAAAFPAYFQALADCNILAAADAHHDARTSEFSANYLTPLGITSMLDVPICLNGVLEGVLCHEHIGPPRQWTSDERTFAVAIANLVTLVLEEWERKQAQEELRRSQQAYAALVNTVDGIVWEADVPSFGFTFVSEQAERIVGYPAEQWLNQPTFWIDHVHPEDRSWVMDFCVRATKNKEDHDFRYRMIASDGREVWLHDLVTVVSENSRVTKLRGIMVDVTESKRAEEVLRWRTAFFEAQVDSDLDGILVVDSAGKKVLQNQRLNDLWKIPPHIAGDPDDAKQVQFVTSRTRHPQRFAEKVAYLEAHTEEISRDEIELVDGMVLDRYSSPVRDKSGKYYGRIWKFRDITERKQLEEQLRQSQKMEAVGQLAGGVAHDFNNLLAVIQMQSSLLLTEANVDHDVKEGIQDIMAAAERAANLTRQLLTFSRRETKQAKHLDIVEVAGTLTKLLRRVLGEDIAFETHFAPSLPTINADPGMIEQVLMNLVVNARDAMPDGGRLRLTLDAVTVSEEHAARHPGATPGRHVCLSVSDTGCGISPENITRIFEPFFTTKEVGKGTGLGLATVFGIVQQHQGWIELESELGAGTTFRVFLPATEMSAAQAVPAATAPRIVGGHETILLVEDEPAVRTVTRAVLEHYGYHIVEADCAAAALRVWDSQTVPPDLLITDLIMPGGVTGRELADQLAAREPRLKIIYTSGYSNDVVNRQLRLNATRNFLQKPCSASELASTVRRCLDGMAVENGR